MRWIAAAGIAGACSGGGSTGKTIPSDLLDKKAPGASEVTPAGRPVEAPAVLPQLTIETACARFEVLASRGCDWTQRFPPAFRDGPNCQNSLMTWISPSNPTHVQLQHTLDCWQLECDEASNCMVLQQQNAPPPPPRSCGEEGTAAIMVDAATWAARRGVGAKKFADVKTSETEPVEVCDIGGEVTWMTTVTCNDGSNPYPSQEAANGSRDAWLGRGGRCNSILDRYSVKCPETTYQIYVDRYVCPKP